MEASGKNQKDNDVEVQAEDEKVTKIGLLQILGLEPVSSHEKSMRVDVYKTWIKYFAQKN